MSIWANHDLTAKVVDILGSFGNPEAHHFGRHFITAYQLAIELEARYPRTVKAIGKPIGGAGTGQETSLTQYLARELSSQIKAIGAVHRVEGAFLASEHVTEFTFSTDDGTQLTSSLTGTGYPLSMFRLRPSPTP